MRVDHAIVLGCPRSGTTFLMRVLNTLPEVECVTGTLLPVAIPHIVNQPLAPDVYEALAVGFERSLDAYLHSGRYLSRAGALQKWAATRDGLTSLRQAVRGKRSVRRIIYKEPFLSLAPEFVDDALPDATIIYIYRDGRDCANSLVRSYAVLTDEGLTHLRGSEMRLGRRYDHRYIPWWVEEGRDEEFIAASPYVRAIWMWTYMVRRCRTYYGDPGAGRPERVLQVRYEDLMQRPREVGNQILAHLGASANTSWHRVLDQAHTRSIGKYRQRNPEEIAAAEAVAGEELAAYGYEVSTTMPAPTR